MRDHSCGRGVDTRSCRAMSPDSHPLPVNLPIHLPSQTNGEPDCPHFFLVCRLITTLICYSWWPHLFLDSSSHRRRSSSPTGSPSRSTMASTSSPTALVLQCSAAIKDVKVDFQRHLNGDDGQGRVTEVDAQNATLETPTPTPKGKTGLDCITSTTTEIASHRVSSIGNSSAQRNTANSLLVAETPT